MARRIMVAHSPDADDAFMFYALAQGKIGHPDLEFIHVLEDIQTLNDRARRGQYEVTAVSFHAYAYLADRYALLPHGASMGDGYGPMIVARRRMRPDELRGQRIAVPGILTTAVLALQLWNPGLEQVVIPFDQIPDAVALGTVDAGLLIHEGQVTYASLGLHKVVDLGEWWTGETGLPLPLGGNVIRKDLGLDLMRRISRLLRESIRYSLDHRDEALAYAMQFGRTMDRGLADRFVGMYVNDLTLEYGERGRVAVRRLLALGYERGLIPQRVEPEFVE
ncbi:MAG TPA: MqnA/MqnD/SBP family protein [Candidatus Methylomirabilis sp.]|nr:MqnA/MqnD/SBP family protein [Candidatus Methylomirabilis sp.]